jgi:hypothetical protein
VTTYDPIERARRARRQAASVFALVALAAVLVMIAAFRIWTGGPGASAPGPAPTSTVANDGGPDLRWRPFLPGRDLPESITAGPMQHAATGQAGGFARTQLGAALAAIHLGHRIDPAAGSKIFEPTIKEQVVGPYAGALLDKASERYESLQRQQRKLPGEPLEQGPAQLVAYRVESHNPDAATVAMITGLKDNSKYFSYRLDLQWVDGDWHLVAPKDGDLSTVLTPLQALPSGAVALSRGS